MKVSVSAILLWVVFRRVDLGEVFSSIKKVPWPALVGYVAIMAVVTILASWRWGWWLDRRQQGRVFPALVRATAISYLYNLFMPSSVGGDALKWTSALHLGYTKRQLILSVILDRLSGVVGLVIFGFLSVVGMQLWGSVRLSPVIVWWFTAAFIGTIGAMVLNGTRWSVTSLPLLRRVGFLRETELYLKTAHSAVLASVTISFVIHLVSYYAMFILSEGMQLHISIWYYFTLGSITSLVLILPISFAGFGVTEVSFVYFFTQVGGSKEGILALVALMNIFKFVLALLGWLYDVGCQLFTRRPDTTAPNTSTNE